jgi:hypothetical protein
VCARAAGVAWACTMLVAWGAWARSRVRLTAGGWAVAAEGLMGMIKDLYQQGDANTQRTIQEAWKKANPAPHTPQPHHPDEVPGDCHAPDAR